MKIGETRPPTKLNASAIRYYEKMGVLVAPSASAASAVIHRLFRPRPPHPLRHRRGVHPCEIKLFLSGLRDNAPVGPRWKKTRQP